jgi:hypothetical protein
MVKGIRVFTALSVAPLLVAVLLAGGCATAPVPGSKLRPAPARCMASPDDLPVLAVGDDLVEKHGRLRRSYARETSKLACTQRYIRTITRQ